MSFHNIFVCCSVIKYVFSFLFSKWRVVTIHPSLAIGIEKFSFILYVLSKYETYWIAFAQSTCHHYHANVNFRRMFSFLFNDDVVKNFSKDPCRLHCHNQRSPVSTISTTKWFQFNVQLQNKRTRSKRPKRPYRV